jgi:uncharacterized protein YgiM (DUF1202 family)
MQRTGLLVFSLLALLTAAVPAVAAETSSAVVSGAELLYVRRGPGTNFPAFATIPHGERVEVERLEGPWAFVRLSSGRTGYVYSTYLSFPGQTQATVMILTTPTPTATATPEAASTATATEAAVVPNPQAPAEAAPAAVPNTDVAALRQEIQQLTATVGSLQKQLNNETATGQRALSGGVRFWLTPTSVTFLVVMALLIGWLAGSAYGRQSERSRRSRIRF